MNFFDSKGTLTVNRIPFTSWRQLSTANPTIFSFNRNYLRRKIYAGGFVPISSIDVEPSTKKSTKMFGVHASWSSGSSVTTTDLKMKLDVNIQASFEWSQDIQLGQVIPGSSDRHLTLHMANLSLK